MPTAIKAKTAPRLSPAALELLRQKILALFAENPELEDDEECRLDMVEGETDALVLLDRLSDLVIGEVALQAAIKERRADLASRGVRSERREQALRSLGLSILDLIGMRTVRLAEATLSAQPAPPAVQITDQGGLPPKYWRVKQEPNIAEISTDLKLGINIPGASLTNRRDILVVRRK